MVTNFALRPLRAAAASLALLLALPVAAETSLPLVPGEDDRAVATAQAQAPEAALVSLVQMVAIAPAAVDVRAASAADLDCLATAVWFESRSEPLEGQLAVAQAVVNRATSGRWGKGVCSVITAPHQFNFNPAKVQRGSASFTTAMAVARIAMQGLWHDVASGAHSFHSARLNPGWRLTRVARIGNHVFYR